MVQKKLKCRDSDYEFMKEVRWKFNRTSDEIKELKIQMEQVSQEDPPNEFGMQVRQEEIRSLTQRKKQLNAMLKEAETNCFGSEE